MANQHTVFISYSHDSETHVLWALKFADRLQSEVDISVVFDQYELWPGKDVARFMERGLSTDRVVLLLTAEYLRKVQERREISSGVGYESTIISAQILQGAEEDRFIPVLREPRNVSVPPYFDSTLFVDMCEDSEFENKIQEVLRGIRREPLHKFQGSSATPKPLTQGCPLDSKISERGLWRLLQEAAIKAVVAGGIESMNYYRIPAEVADFEFHPRTNSKNPTTKADLAGTADAFEAIHQRLSSVSRRCGCTLKYLAEDAVIPDSLSGKVSQELLEHLKDPDDFFTDEENEIRIILDAIDGTGSFALGIPLFCSAIAIMVGKSPRVSALYDPIHHVVYSAMIRPDNDPFAQAWSVSGSERVDLRYTFDQSIGEQGPFHSAVGVHFSRTNIDIVSSWVKQNRNISMLEDLSKLGGSLYAINSGILAMKYVAEGGLGAFLNPQTNLWDVAPGEVLIKACGGKVTNMNGCEIDYTSNGTTSVLAARDSVYDDILALCQRHFLEQ